MLLLPLLCIFLALESAGAQEAGDSTPSRNLASKLERRLDDLIAANKQEAIETCNDYFYVLSRIGASQKARLGALEKIQARLSSDDSDWIGLRTDYLLSNYPVTSAQDLQTVNLAITMGAHSFFLTESETFDLAQRIAAIKSNDLHDIELKMRTLYLLSEQARSDFDFKKKFCLAALEAGMSKQAMADDHLHGLFYALLYCYDRPSSRTEEHDFRLVKAVQDLTQNATVNMKHEFLINPFPGGLFSEIRLCSNSETLQSTLTTLAEKMDSIGASKSSIADAFT